MTDKDMIYFHNQEFTTDGQTKLVEEVTLAQRRSDDNAAFIRTAAISYFPVHDSSRAFIWPEVRIIARAHDLWTGVWFSDSIFPIRNLNAHEFVKSCSLVVNCMVTTRLFQNQMNAALYLLPWWTGDAQENNQSTDWLIDWLIDRRRWTNKLNQTTTLIQYSESTKIVTRSF